MRRKWIIFGLNLVAGAGIASAGLFDSWSFNAKLVFAGYDRPETLLNFPFLVTLADGSNGFHYADMNSPSDAADLRFASRDGGAELPYEIEKWDTNGVSVVWVRAPQITGASDYVWAHWGQAGQSVPAYATNGAAWDSGEIGVWHMAQANAEDSTSNRFNGTAYGTAAAVEGGMVGRAGEFHATTDYIQVPDSPRFTLGSAYTMSAWIRPNPSAAYQAILGTYVGSSNGFILTVSTNANNRLMFWSNSSWRTNAVGTTDGVWTHVAYARNGSTARFYVNGTVTTNITNPVAVNDGGPLQIGAGGTNWPTQRFDGRIDEVRLSGVDRGSNWIYAAWRNQDVNSTFLSMLPGFPAISNTVASGVLDRSADLGSEMTVTGGYPTTVYAFWGTNDAGASKTWTFSSNLGVRAAGGLVASVADLDPNRSYFYTFYASNAQADAWGGPSGSFETWGPPDVRNDSTVPEYTNAYVYGNLLDGIGADAWIQWGQDPESLTNVTYAGSFAEGPFSGTLTGLQNDASFYYRFYVSNAYGTALSAVTNFSTRVAGLVWTGAGANSLASNTNNWQNGIRPATGDAVHLDGSTVKPMTWDLSNVVLRAWNQDAGYTNAVTIATRYPGQGAFTNMIVSEDVRIMGGSWTHPANTGGGTPADRLMVTIGGDLIVGTNGQVNAAGKGYATAQGPGAGMSTDQRSYGASHGGLGGEGPNSLIPRPTYGSLFDPVTLGSGGSQPGGGAIQLDVGGTTRVYGSIRADAAAGTGRHSGTAGGSIWLKTARLEGVGLIRAAGRGGTDGTDASGAGGGGRIAVWLTASSSFGGVTIQAPSIKDSSSTYGAAGTVYLQAQTQARGEGALVIDNQNSALGYFICTMMPEASAFNGASDLTRLEAVIVTNRGILGVNTNTAFDFGGGNLRVHPGLSTVSVFGTNGLAFPPFFTLSPDYALHLNCPLTATGDWVVPAGVNLTHLANLAAEAFKLQLTLSGNLTVEGGGQINVASRGYRAGAGPAAGSSSTYQYGGGYGGMGGMSWMSNVASRALYGSVTAPTNLGSGAYYAGGGAVILDIAGTTTVSGTISVSPPYVTTGYPNGAGGSIFLRTGWLTGTGLLAAAGGPASFRGSAGNGSAGGGGGGRLAVRVAQGESLGNVRLDARGGPNTSTGWAHDSGAAGTIYTEIASQAGGRGRVLIANDNRDMGLHTNTLTYLPAASGAISNELRYATVVISNRAYVALTGDLTIGDLYLMTNTPNYLSLKGYTLYVNTRFHKDWGITNYVAYDGGSIVWGGLQRGALIMIR